jgi:acyl-CoA thioesterase YciA
MIIDISIEDLMQPKKSEPIHSWSFVFPSDANPQGTMFGGRLLAMMDMVAGVAASRYTHTQVVTASTDSITFTSPLFIGDRIEIIARVVWVGKTSMVIKTDVFGEHPLRGDRKHCTTAHFVFIAIDKNQRPAPLPPLFIETEDQQREYEAAALVKQQSLDRKKQVERPTPPSER